MWSVQLMSAVAYEVPWRKSREARDSDAMGAGLCREYAVAPAESGPMPEAPRIRLLKAPVTYRNVGKTPIVNLELSDRALLLSKAPSAEPTTDFDQILLPTRALIGAQCLAVESGSTSALFAVHAYPRAKAGLRTRHTFVFRAESSSADTSRSFAEKWCSSLHELIHSACPGRRGAGEPRRLYVLVNPHSGPGKALQIFQQQVLPVLSQGNAVASLVITAHPGHASELAKALRIEDWDGLLIVSGDGLLYEVVNGLMSRPDAAEVLAKLPLGIVPGGSGNGMAATLCFEEGDSFRDWVMSRTLAAAAPSRLLPMPLMRVETAGGHVSHAFLSLSWGFLADIDIESEKFRKTLGPARFTLGALMKLASMRSYLGRVSYLPAADVSGVFGRDGRPEDVSGTKRRSSHGVGRSVSESQAPDDSGRVEGAPAAISASVGNLASLRTSVSVSEAPLPLNPPRHRVAFPERGARGAAVDLQESSSVDLRLSDPLPEGWVVSEDKFLFVMVTFVSHLSDVLPYMPRMRLGDDVAYLTLVRERNISRAAALKLLLSMESSAFLQCPALEVHAVRGIRIETLGEGGTIAVDGELVRTTAVQATPSGHSARLMSRHPRVDE